MIHTKLKRVYFAIPNECRLTEVRKHIGICPFLFHCTHFTHIVRSSGVRVIL